VFYCPGCAKKKGWPESLARSQGACEVCRKVAVCYDTPSKYLLGTPTVEDGPTP